MKTFTPARIVALVGAVLVIASAFLAWGTVNDIVVIRGIEGDGIITSGLAGLGLILLLIKQVPRWISIILAACITGVSLFTFSNLKEIAGENGAGIGTGLYITIVAGLVMFAAIVVSYFVDKKTA